MNKEEAIKYLQQLYPNGGHCWLDEQRIEAIGMAIKALQEEPVSDIDFEQELYKAFGQVKDFTLGMRIAKWFYDMGKKNQEHVSEDLGEYINELSKQFPEVSFAKLSRIAVRVSRWQQNQDVKNKLPKVTDRTELDEYAYQCAYDMSNGWAIENPTWHDVEMACKLGANWQKEQFEKNRLAACDRQTEEEAEREQDFVMGIIENEHRKPTFNDAIKYGMRLNKEQMMKDTVEAKVYNKAYPTEFEIETNTFMQKLKHGDNVKLIIIKEK